MFKKKYRKGGNYKIIRVPVVFFNEIKYIGGDTFSKKHQWCNKSYFKNDIDFYTLKEWSFIKFKASESEYKTKNLTGTYIKPCLTNIQDIERIKREV
jgi:hypothetical protein